MKLFGKDQAFYNGQVKKYTALFGSLFSDLYILRSENEYVKVPIRYANGNFRNKGDSGLLNQKPRSGSPLPAMAFELINIASDPVRRTNQHITVRGRGVDLQSPNDVKFSVAPTPYNLTYNLTVRTKTLDDSFQILEQIVANFNPHLSVEVVDSEDLNLIRDVTIKLESTSFAIEDNYTETQDETRQVEINLEFTLYGYLYKKTQEGSLVLHAKLIGTLDGEEFGFGEEVATPSDLKSLADNADIGQGHKGLADFGFKVDKETK